jgi:very-short-patch-repair endonuclease
MTKHYNKIAAKIHRRRLRKVATKTERLLWKYLKRKRLDGYKFRRQYSIDNFIVDFYCVEKKLVIELDGESHNRKEIQDYDKVRQEYIETFGIKFIRFSNSDVVNNIEQVIEYIRLALQH